MQRLLTARASRAFVVALVIGVAVTTSAAAGASGGGVVLPAAARPHGATLSDLTGAVALFTTSGNDQAYYPNTPFQVLYADPSTSTFTPDGCGFQGRGTNTLTVDAGATSYVPIINIDDSPPVFGTYPTTPAAGRDYMFDPDQIGTHDVFVTVDGRRTDLGPAYVGGPVTTPPLLDGGGTHMLTVGAFLTPFAVGHHVVTIGGAISGALVPATVGACFVNWEFTYTIDVHDHG
jgi:hypothetical protein